MDWNAAVAQNHTAMSNTTNGDLFIRLKDDGDSVIVAIIGEPEARKVVWDGSRTVDYDPAIHVGERPKTRWMLNAFDVGEKSMKILEANQQLFRQLATVREKFPLEQWLVQIKRQGRAGDPKTTYSVLPEKQMTPQQTAHLNGGGVQLHDLTQYAGTAKPVYIGGSTTQALAAAAAQDFGDDDIPF